MFCFLRICIRENIKEREMDRKRRELIGLIATAPLAFALPATAKETPIVKKNYGNKIREHNFRLSNDDAASAPGPVATRYFADYVNKASDGKIKIETYPSSVLGKANAIMGSLQAGLIDFALMGSPYLTGLVQEYGLLDLPYSFQTSQQAYEVLDGPMGAVLLGKLEKHGMTGLGFWEIGFRDVTNNIRPIKRWEDLQGLKIRTVPSPIFIKFFNSLGANPVPMAISEVYTALGTGTIDAQANPPTIIAAWKFDEVQKYLSMTKHIYTSYTFLGSKKVLSGLNDQEHELIMDAAVKARSYQRKLAQKQNDELMVYLKETMEVNRLDQRQLDRFHGKAEALYPEFKNEFDDKELYEKWIQAIKTTAPKDS